MDASDNFVSNLLILFITLKLVGVISWTWWWVMSPLWIVLLISILIIMFAMVFGKKGGKGIIGEKV